MGICCSQDGNNTVNFKPDCYSWCNLKLGDGSDSESDRWDDVKDVFKDCLESGNGSRPATGMVCSFGNGRASDDKDGMESSSAGDTSHTSSPIGESSETPSPTDDSLQTVSPTEDASESSAAAPDANSDTGVAGLVDRAGSAKAAGLVSILLGAGFDAGLV